MGANDIEAAFLLRDEVSNTLHQIDRSIQQSTTATERNFKKSTKAITDFGLGMFLVRKIFREAFEILNKNEDFREFRESWQQLSGNSLDFSYLKSFTNQINTTNARDELDKLIKKMGELSEAKQKKDPKDPTEQTFLASPREREALQELINKIQEKIDIQNNALGIMIRITKQSEDMMKIQDALSSVGILLPASWLKAETSVLSYADALEQAKVQSEKIKESTKEAEKAAKEFESARVRGDKEFSEAIVRSEKEAAERSLEAWKQTFEGGFSSTVQQIEDEFTNLGKIAGRFATETHATISNDLFSALKRDGITFGKFMSHILDSILKQVTDATSASFLGLFKGGAPSFLSLFPGGSSSSAPSSASSAGAYGDIPQRGEGGYFNRPELAIIGDKPETIIPDSKMPAFLRQARGGGDTIVNNFNISTSDPMSFDAYLRANGGRAIRDHVESAIRSRSRIRGLVN